MSNSDLTDQHIHRKTDHIDICTNTDVESSDKKSGFEDFFLEPYSLCELNQEDIDTQTSFLNRNFSTPMMITGMTGGTEQGQSINLNLARAAAAYNIPMGVGSQRIAVEDSKFAGIFQVKKQVPGVYLIANMGISQLLTCKDPAATLRKAIDMIDADAVAIHINVMQELVQPEGDRDFKGTLETLRTVTQELKQAIIIKEVGCGMDQKSIEQLIRLNIDGLDVGGRGGTSWPLIESLRSEKKQRWSQLFRDWGIPTAHSLAVAAQIDLKSTSLVATGGIRSGIDVAKAIGLGADICGIGLPFFRAALHSSEHVMKVIEDFHEELMIVMQACGCKALADLKKRIHYGTPYREALLQFNK